MTDFDLHLTSTGADTAVLTWKSTDGDPELLLRLIIDTAERAFADGVRRLEVALPADDSSGRRALFRAGFRLEGRRRQAVPGSTGALVDEIIFARLTDDVVEGPQGFSAVANSLTPRKRLIAHVLMRDDRDRVLLCDTTFKADLELPGGIVEPGEAPRTAAIREVKEELGIDIVPGALLAIDWMPPYLGWEDACELIFDGGPVTDEDIATFTFDQHEIVAATLIDLPAAEPHLTALSYRRLTSILAADPGGTLILEDGREAPPR